MSPTTPSDNDFDADTQGESDVSELRKEIERDWYDKTYGAGTPLSSGAVRQRILRASEKALHDALEQYVRPGSRVLEIGCGDGTKALQCARMGADVVGIDISERAIETAVSRARELNLQDRCRFQVADAEKLPFGDGSFDVILNHEVFSSVRLPETLAECCRTLNSTGVFIGMECLGHNPVFNINRRIKSVFGRRTRWAASHIFNEADIALFQRRFQNVRVEYFHLLSAFGGPLVLALPENLQKCLIDRLDQVDRFLFKSALVRKLAFKVVISAIGPLKSV